MRDYVEAKGGRRGVAPLALVLVMCLALTGHAEPRLSVRGVSFSAPTSFSPELRMLSSEAGFLQHTRFALGIFVAVPEDPDDEQVLVVTIAIELAKELFPNENPRY